MACTLDDPAWVDTIALCEMVWALESAYGYARSIVVGALRQLLGLAELLRLTGSRVGRAACLRGRWRGLRGRSDGAAQPGEWGDTTYTFDRRAAQSATRPFLGALPQ